MAHPWDVAMSPCPPRLPWSPGVCEWSSRSLRSILAHAATAPMSARAGRLPSPWAEKQKAHERAQPPPHAARTSATLLLGFRCRCRCRCVEAGRITHTCCKSLPTLPCPVSIPHPTIAKHGRRRPSLCTSLSACLSVCHYSVSRAGRLTSILVCASPPLSALCSVLPSCTRAHTGLASSGRARCSRWRCP